MPVVRFKGRKYNVSPVLNQRTREAIQRVKDLEPSWRQPYFFGRLCKHGHDHWNGFSMRRWSDRRCVECYGHAKPEIIFDDGFFC
jgi:hypothetical protein